MSILHLITAAANDYSYEAVFKRLVRAMGNKGDILIGLSTSVNSRNALNALNQARMLGMTTVGFTGVDGGEMKYHCDILFDIPSKNIPRIQECHMIIGHSICELVEQGLFPK